MSNPLVDVKEPCTSSEEEMTAKWSSIMNEQQKTIKDKSNFLLDYVEIIF